MRNLAWFLNKRTSGFGVKHATHKDAENGHAYIHRDSTA